MSSNILSHALADVRPWAVASDSQPQVGCVRLRADVETQILELTCGDMLHSLTVSLPATVAEGGVVSLPVKEMATMAKVLPSSEEVELSVNDRHTVKMTCGRRVMSVAGLPGADYCSPKGPAANADRYEISGALLSRVLHGPLYAVCSDDTRAVACQLIVDVDDDTIESMATDGHRAALCAFADHGIGFRGQIRLIRHGAQRLAKVAGSVPEWTFDIGDDESTRKPSIRFTSTAGVLTLAQHRMPPLPIRRILPEASAGECSISREGMYSLIEALKVALPTSGAVRIKIDKDGLTGEASDRVRDKSVHDSCEVHDCAGEIDMAVSGVYLSDAVAALAGCETIRVKWTDSLSPLLLEGGGAVHMVMSVRPD